MFSKRLNELLQYKASAQMFSSDYLRLNANESPYPPCPAILKKITLEHLNQLNRYPDISYNHLRKNIAKHHQVENNNIFISNGLNELLFLAFFTFYDETTTLLMPRITYNYYPVYCRFHNIRYMEIEQRADFSIDIAGYLVQNDNCAIVFANPNPPAGSVLTHVEILLLLEKFRYRVFIIDEAYVDFYGISAVELVEKYQNLLVLRTFSKGYGLAGARVGYAIGNTELINALYKVRDSFNCYNVNSLSQNIARMALEDQTYYLNIFNKIITVRDNSIKSIKEADFICSESKGNFLFIAKKKFSGQQLSDLLKENYVLVKTFTTPGTENFIRVTIGTAEDMQFFLKIFKQIVS